MKNILVIVFTVILVTSCSARVLAQGDDALDDVSSNNQNVQNKLKSICDPLVGTNYPYEYYYGGSKKAGGCQAFAMSIYEKLFGYSYYGNPNKTNKRGDQTNWDNLGNYLKNNARPGDVLRAYCSDETKAHAVILYSINSDNMTYYESEGKTSSNKVKKTTITYDAFKNTYNGRGCPGYFIYQIYDDVYNSIGGGGGGGNTPTGQWPYRCSDCEIEPGSGQKIKEGEYVIASKYSLDEDTMKLNSNPYVMEEDSQHVVYCEKGLDENTSTWKFENEGDRFYTIRNVRTGRYLSLTETNKDRKTQINTTKIYPDDCTLFWSFWEKWDDQFTIENQHSEMPATKSDGNTVRQVEWYGRSDDRSCRQVWLFISPEKPNINTSSIPSGSTGKSYSSTLSGSCDHWVAIKWSASNLPAGLSMSPDGVISGTPTEAGDFNVKVDATNFFGTTSKTYNIVIEETYIPVTGVTLPENETVEVGSNFTLTPNIIPSNATDKTRTWVSSEPAVATVNENGVVTGVKEGQTEITVTTNSKDGSHSAKCTVTVSPKPIPFVPGDVTMDGYVYMDDVLMLSRAVAGTYTLTEEQEKRGDVTGDQKIGMNDVVKVARFVAGTLDSL